MLTWSPARVYSTITNGYLGPTLTQPVRKRSCIMISVRRNSRDDNHEAHITVHCMLNVGLVTVMCKVSLKRGQPFACWASRNRYARHFALTSMLLVRLHVPGCQCTSAVSVGRMKLRQRRSCSRTR